MTQDVVQYLNPRDFYSRLRDQIEACKMAKMPPAQWVSYIKGLASKGVKLVEIQDVKVLPWLETCKEKSLTKEDLLLQYDRMAVTVKEVILGSPKYAGYSHANLTQGDVYQEILYIANSEASNMQDRIEEIEFTMEELAFDQDMLLANPGLATRLEQERKNLLVQKVTAIDFPSHHFSDQVNGKHGKNLLFHIRVVISKKPNGQKLFFIDEIQSDWGQRGRVRGHHKDRFVPPGDTRAWKDIPKAEQDTYRAAGVAPPSWNAGIPQGPWVTDTNLWAGLAVRRILQRAAADKDVDEVSWIRLAMRNGGMTDPRVVDRAAAAQTEDDAEETDHYYCRLIPKLAETALGKSGVKVTYDNVIRLKGKDFGNLPGFKMTPAAREALAARQPLYSAAEVLRYPAPVPDERLSELLEHGKKMLGSAARIHFVASLLDFQDMTYKSGSYMNRIMSLALNGRDISRALDHEAYHCAHELFLNQAEKNAMAFSFRNGTALNDKVVRILLDLGEERAARQCNDSEEAAAHGFSLWRKGLLVLEKSHEEAKPKSVFQKVAEVLVDVVRWIAGESLELGVDAPEQVFRALANGDFARQRVSDEQSRRMKEESHCHASERA